MAKYGRFGLALALVFSSAVLAQTADELFDDQILHEVRLEVDPADWATLRDNYLENTFYRAKFSWRGADVENIGIRSRGSGSRSPLKPNLLVRFDRNVSGQRFAGLQRLVLKANNQDASMMTETASLWLTRLMGLPASRAAHARLLVNGEYFGLYTIVEDITEDFLERAFDDRDGYLYEYEPTGQFRFDYRGDDPEQYWFLEPKTHESNPRMDVLVEMVRAINFAPREQFIEQVAPYLNLDRFVRLVAIQNYLADNDGVLSNVFGMNNFYLYRASASTTSEFIPWDMDLTFTWPQHPILRGIENSVLSERALAVPELRQTYLRTLIDAATIAGGTGGLLQRELRRQYRLIAAAARTEPNKQCMKTGVTGPCTAADFEAAALSAILTPPVRTPFVIEEVLRLLPPEGGPVTRAEAVVNAATSAPLLAPGGLACLYGEALSEEVGQTESLPLPYEINGVSVKVNGVPAPVLFVSPFQVNFQVPWGTPVGVARIEVSGPDGASSEVEATVGAVAPGIFAAFRAEDYAPITTTNPIGAGETMVIYATGLGAVTPPVGDGEAPDAEMPPVTIASADVTVGGQAATVLFSGLAPGLPGVFQVDAELPEGVPAGHSTPIVVSINGQASPEFGVATK